MNYADGNKQLETNMTSSISIQIIFIVNTCLLFDNFSVSTVYLWALNVYGKIPDRTNSRYKHF